MISPEPKRGLSISRQTFSLSRMSVLGTGPHWYVLRRHFSGQGGKMISRIAHETGCNGRLTTNKRGLTASPVCLHFPRINKKEEIVGLVEVPDSKTAEQINRSPKGNRIPHFRRD